LLDRTIDGESDCLLGIGFGLFVLFRALHVDDWEFTAQRLGGFLDAAMFHVLHRTLQAESVQIEPDLRRSFEVFQHFVFDFLH